MHPWMHPARCPFRPLCPHIPCDIPDIPSHMHLVSCDLRHIGCPFRLIRVQTRHNARMIVTCRDRPNTSPYVRFIWWDAMPDSARYVFRHARFRVSVMGVSHLFVRESPKTKHPKCPIISRLRNTAIPGLFGQAMIGTCSTVPIHLQPRQFGASAGCPFQWDMRLLDRNAPFGPICPECPLEHHLRTKQWI
jgi:hypothetical protein